MGAISPVPFANKAFLKKIEDKIIQPTINGLALDQIDYKGFVFIGIIKVDDEPFVIEYNVRMGDPETQVVLPRIKNDFLEMMICTAEQSLGKINLQIDPKSASTVVMVSGGYPEEYEKGLEISGIPNNSPSSIIFSSMDKSFKREDCNKRRKSIVGYFN